MDRPPVPGLHRWLCALAGLVLYGTTGAASAWIYPEHRDIALLAVQDLDAERKAVFDRLWQDARAGNESRFCAHGADPGQGLAPECIDWAALSGIAGDHSCSSRQMLETVRDSDWIFRVADIAAQLKADLAGIPIAPPARRPGEKSTVLTEAMRQFDNEKHRAARVNALRVADTRMQRADADYALRADTNLAHFLLARPDTSLDPLAYAALALNPGSELNAPGVYLWFHISALRKAGRLAREPLAPEERRRLASSALFDEAFALHFLEDMYAAGHVAGSWGDVSQRKGTHDFYNENGLEVFTWRGRDRTVVLMGDAHMRPQDAELTARSVKVSLEQVLDAAVGRPRGYELPEAPDADGQPDDFDICATAVFPDRGLGLAGAGRHPYAAATDEVLYDTPVPGLGPGLGALPRTRSEVGAFVGMTAAMDGRAFNRGFVPSGSNPGAAGGLDVGFRVGLGMEGALGDAGDGLIFAQLGWRAETPSSGNAAGTLLEDLKGSLGAAIPSRNGPSGRIRMPFYLVPGDLLLLSPLYLLDREAYTRMAVTAASGGLIPWQRPWNTAIGRFQFVFGRELGVAWLGATEQNQLAAPSDPPGGIGRIVNYRSLSFDLPILEYRPFRSYSGNQSSTILVQAFAGVDVPSDVSIAAPEGAPPVDLRPIYSLGLRLLFDWRYYR